MKKRILPDPIYFKKDTVIRTDYEEVELTFISSSKGGLGKTTFAETIIISKMIRDPRECAVCHKRFKKLTDSHLKVHGMDRDSYNSFLRNVAEVHNPVIIDANENNQDLVVIFDGFKDASRPVETDSFVMRELRPTEDSKSTFILVYPKRHLHFASEMYEFTQLVIDSIPSRKCFVVDSAFHIERFVVHSDINKDGSITVQSPHLHGSIAPRFLFLWRWSAPANYIEIQKIERAVNWLRIAIPNWTDDNFISVFNLYDLYHQTTNRNLNRIVSIWDRNIKRDHIVSPINFNDLIDLIEKLRLDMRGYKIGKTIEIRKIPSLWIRFFHQLLRILKVKHANKPVIPSNIILIPTFYRGLVMTIDGLTLDRPSNILELAENMKPFIERLQMFFRIRTRVEETRLRQEKEIYRKTWREVRSIRYIKDVIVLSLAADSKYITNILHKQELNFNIEIVKDFQALSLAIKFNRYKYVFLRLCKNEEDKIEAIIKLLEILGDKDSTKIAFLKYDSIDNVIIGDHPVIVATSSSFILESISHVFDCSNENFYKLGEIKEKPDEELESL
jgi:hypothetical protein